MEVLRQPEKNRQGGHIEIGFTLAAMIVIGLILYISYTTGAYSLSAMFDLWLSQTWWVKLLSIVVPLLILFAGYLLERAGQWPKAPGSD